MLHQSMCHFVVLRSQPWSNVLYNESTSVYNDTSRLTQITLLCISCRNHHPMLLAQWQQGVTRSDLAKEFSFEEFMKVCDRFIARKLVQRFYDKALAFGLKGYAKLSNSSR
ncbi:hypothetical protein VPH35_139039 [Triticum aestivum]